MSICDYTMQPQNNYNMQYDVSWALILYKMASYQYRKSQCGDKTVVRSSYLHNGNSYTDKTAFYVEWAPWRCESDNTRRGKWTAAWYMIILFNMHIPM